MQSPSFSASTAAYSNPLSGRKGASPAVISLQSIQGEDKQQTGGKRKRKIAILASRSLTRMHARTHTRPTDTKCVSNNSNNNNDNQLW